MKRIFTTSELATKLCGRQKVKTNIAYRLSRHTLTVPSEDGLLLYQTLTGALFLLEKDERYEDHPEELIQNWILVPEGFDEQKQARDARRVVAMLDSNKSSITGFTVLTTTDCNARCYYCFEMGKRRFSMSEETAHDVAAYIMRASGGNKIRISWFGGEPLYNKQAMDAICEDLQLQGREYTAIIVTNAYYLDNETAKRAAQFWHTDLIQITLDGTHDVYNRTKAYIDSEGDPFERVLKNTGYALDAGNRVQIRLNMDERNADDLSLLCDVLAERFPGRKRLNVYVAPLAEIVGKIHHFETAQAAVEKYTLLQRKIWSLGIGAPASLNREFITNRCQADSRSYEVILPDGRINRCEHFDENEVVGSIYDEKRDAAIVRSWQATCYFPECDDCVLYPRCINLIKCDDLKNGCSESRKMIKRFKLEQEVLAAYQKEKNRQE